MLVGNKQIISPCEILLAVTAVVAVVVCVVVVAVLAVLGVLVVIVIVIVIVVLLLRTFVLSIIRICCILKACVYVQVRHSCFDTLTSI